MTIEEANELLDAAPQGNTPARINPGLTLTQAVEIVRKAVNGGPRALDKNGQIEPWLEKRVKQVTQNRIQPR